MSLIVGTNSYVAATDVDAYMSDRIYSSEWTALDSSDKDKACITGTSLLDSLCDWYGDKTNPDQALAFPRDGDTSVPNDVLKACYEIILEIVKQQKVSFVDSSESLKSLKAGPASFSFYELMNNPITVVNSIAKSILKNYGNCFFGGSIQVVNTVR